VDWIYLAHDNMNDVMNFRVPCIEGISRLAEELLSFQE
jgi:hypothetical protein